EILQIVEIADDLFRLGADTLHRLREHVGRVITERDPPQERVADLYLRALQTVKEAGGAISQLAVAVEADRAEIVRIDLGPVFRLLQKRGSLAGTERGVDNDRQ